MPHLKGLEGEVKLCPGAALDFGPGVIAGAGGNNHYRRLFTGPAAGETEFIVISIRFHRREPRRGAACRAPVLPITLSF